MVVLVQLKYLYPGIKVLDFAYIEQIRQEWENFSLDSEQRAIQQIDSNQYV